MTRVETNHAVSYRLNQIFRIDCMSSLQDLYTTITSDVENKKRKSYDHISYRILFIRKLLEKTPLSPQIDIPLSNIGSSNDVRKVLDKKTLNFSDVMGALGCKLLYVKSGSTGHTFRGVLNAGQGVPPFNCAVKVVPYPKRERYGSMNDARRPENVELLMLRVLSRFVLDNQTPHIVLPICTFNTSIRPFIKIGGHHTVQHKRYKEFVDRYERGEFYETVSILISEWANGGDLLDYLRRNYSAMKLIYWKVIFFQFLSTLAIIHKEYPDFRLNDAKCNNILVHRIESHRQNCHKYVINGVKYRVPNIGIQIKIWDHDFSCIPSLVRNSKVEAKWTDKINVKPVQNRYYDAHMFFCTLVKKGFCPEILTSPLVPDDVKQFINGVVPQQYKDGSKVTEKGRLLVDTEYLIPEEMILDPFFECFVVKDSVPDSQEHS